MLLRQSARSLRPASDSASSSSTVGLYRSIVRKRAASLVDASIWGRAQTTDKMFRTVFLPQAGVALSSDKYGVVSKTSKVHVLSVKKPNTNAASGGKWARSPKNLSSVKTNSGGSIG